MEQNNLYTILTEKDREVIGTYSTYITKNMAQEHKEPTKFLCMAWEVPYLESTLWARSVFPASLLIGAPVVSFWSDNFSTNMTKYLGRPCVSFALGGKESKRLQRAGYVQAESMRNLNRTTYELEELVVNSKDVADNNYLLTTHYLSYFPTYICTHLLIHLANFPSTVYLSKSV